MAVKKRVPAPKKATLDRGKAIDELKTFGRGRKLPKGDTVRDLINEGRRF
jgi:hypothetical protein